MGINFDSVFLDLMCLIESWNEKDADENNHNELKQLSRLFKNLKDQGVIRLEAYDLIQKVSSFIRLLMKIADICYANLSNDF